MQHASSFVNFAESDDEDYVSLDEEDVSVGLQQVQPAVQPSFRAAQPRFNAPAVAPQSESAFGGFTNYVGSFFGSSSAAPEPQAQAQPQAQPTSSFNFGLPSFGFSSSSTVPESDALPQLQAQNAFVPAAPAPASAAPSFSFSAAAPAAAAPPSASSVLREKRKRKKKGKGRRVKEARHKVNTNVVSVDLGTLGSPANQIATGDAVFCQNENCRTILSSLNEIRRQNDGDLKLDEGECVWTCMFCGHRNVCDVEEEEQPQGESQDYILEPGSHEAKNEEESIIVFCVDVSGSMCVSQEVQGRFKLKGDGLAKLQSLNDDHSNQYMVNQRRDTTFVSRLQCVQAAIEDQLAELAKSSPKQKVALVTFSNEVTIIGDGTEGTAQVVAGDKLFNEAECRAAGANFQINLPVSEAQEQLSNALWKLEENGQTALGPALAVSIAIAGQQRGSRVVLCTDGLANVGLGSLETDEDGDVEMEDPVGKWYDDIGNTALNAGVTVSVVSITDDGCRLENLGKVADLSSGEVQRINPLELTKNFRGILSKPVLATHVQARMFIHPGLLFWSDADDRWKGFGRASRPSGAHLDVSAFDPLEVDPPKEAQRDMDSGVASEAAAADEPHVEVRQEVQDIGNVFADSTIFFEYKVVKETIHKYRDLDGLPFQVQISYTRLDGAKMMRVLTQKKPITMERDQVLQNMDYRVISSNAQRKTGRLCEDGDYESARVNTYKNAVWMASHARNAAQEQQGSGYMESNLGFDNMMYAQQQQDVAQGFSFGMANRAQQAQRRSRRNDGFSSAMYASKSSRSSYN